MKKNSKKKDNIILILEVILVVFLFIVSMSSILSNRNKDKGLNKDPFFGLTFLAVRSESMSPSIKEGDMIVVKAIDEDYKFNVGVENGDVITFYDQNDDGTYFVNTHRIVEVVIDGVSYTEGSYALNSSVTIYTQGDNHTVSQVKEVTSYSNILAVYKNVRVPFIGKVTTFLIDSKTNYTIFILFPLLILFIWNLLSFFKSFQDYRNKKKLQEAAEKGEISDELKEIAIREYLAKQKEMAEQAKKDGDKKGDTQSEDNVAKENEEENNK